MATNIQLELTLKEAQKEIQTLRAEVDALKSTSAAAVADELRVLKEVLDRTFRNAGLSNDWYQAKAVNRPAPAEVTPHEVAPAPTSPVVVSRVIREMVLRAKNEATGRGELS